jgi:hypothetical protein
MGEERREERREKTRGEGRRTGAGGMLLLNTVKVEADAKSIVDGCNSG